MVGMLETGARQFTPDLVLEVEKRLGIPRVVINPKWFRRRVA